mgnify:CR=1 FL=1
MNNDREHMCWFIRACLIYVLQVDFVQDDAKSLLVYIIEKYYDKLKHIQYVDIFEKMKIKYDQVHNNVSRFILTVQIIVAFIFWFIFSNGQFLVVPRDS